jgi:hypothetical protein
VEKGTPRICATSVIVKILPKEKNRPKVKNSQNLVTLLPAQGRVKQTHLLSKPGRPIDRKM